jgi:putative hydrolase of the HAD superfamily
MKIQAVFFDMGGTIETFWHTRELRLEATPGIQQRLTSAGIDLNLSNEQLYEVIARGLSCYHRWRMVSLEELPTQRIWLEYIFEGFDLDPKALAAIAEDLMLYIETHYYQRQMRPEMPAVLDAVQKMGLKIGLISNVSSRGQVPTNLTAYGLRHYFDPLVLSSEYGRRKPDPAIFHYAARLAHVPASRCVYVGDRIARDILGARKAGYGMAIQIRHDFNHGEDDHGATPDAVINEMTELLDILKTALHRSADDQSLADGDTQPVRALLFDAGDVLYYRPKRNRKLNTFLKEMGLHVKADHMPQKNLLVQQAYQGQISQDQYREKILQLYGVTQPDQIERGKRILEEEDDDVHFFADIPQTLKALKDQGYLLGIVTDTASSVHTKLKWFEIGGFEDVWDTVISSREMGVRKPHPQIYQAALQQLGIKADQAIFVGHKATELDGARALGMKTVAFNYEKKAEADVYISHFSDLLNIAFIKRSEKISG